MNEKEPYHKLTGKEFKHIFDILPHPAYIWRKVGDDLILIHFNKEAENITEGKIKHLIGIKASEQYKDRPKIIEDLKHCLNEKTKISRETVYKLVTTGKEKILIRNYEFIEPDLVFIHIEDITKQKLAEESLKKEKEEKSMILQAVSDHIIYYDKDQTIIWANRAASDSLNLPNEKIIGRKCYELWQKRKEPCSRCPILRAKEKGMTQTEEMKTPDGRIWMVLGFPVRDDKGEILGMVEITRNITKQKKAEQKLRESEEKFRKIAEQSFMGIGIIQDNQVKYVNEVVAEILEYSVEEMMSWTKDFNITNIIHPEDLTRLREQRELRRAGEFNLKPYVSYRVISKSGKVKWIDQYSKNILYQGREAELITINDITDKKIAEQMLKESEEKFRTIAEQSYMGITIIQDDVIKYANQAMLDIFGYSLDEVSSWQPLEYLKLFPSEDKEYMLRQERRKQDYYDYNAHIYQIHYIKKNGEIGWLDLYSKAIEYKGNPAALVSIINITDKRIFEQRLKESEEKYRDIAELLPDTIFEADLDMNLKYINSAGYSMFGYSAQELDNGLNIAQLLTPDSLKKAEERLSHISEGKSSSPIEYVMVKKDGVKFYSRVNSSPIIKENKITGFRGTVTDINDIKLTEQKLKESEEKYRRAYNRINLYKDLFTHDVNNIFQNILSSNELAMLYSNIPDKLQDFVEVANLIKEQVSRGAKLVSNVQKLSDLEEFEKPLYSIEVYSVLNNVIESIKKNFLYKKIDINFHSLEKKFLIMANELIFDVFENILINAVKHNINQTIEIQIKISENLIENDNFIKIEFVDNGIGIPDSMKDVIFQRDYRKEKASGIGLGLLLVKRILESYKGNVNVSDKIPGDYSKGSKFTILIPES